MSIMYTLKSLATIFTSFEKNLWEADFLGIKLRIAFHIILVLFASENFDVFSYLLLGAVFRLYCLFFSFEFE